MRRISRAAWLAMAGAILASILSVAALVKVAAQPRLATSLAAEPPLLSLVTNDGLLVIHSGGAYRIKSDLRVERLGFEEHGKIIAVRSVAQTAEGIWMLASIERNGPPELHALMLSGNALVRSPSSEQAVGVLDDGVYGYADGRILHDGKSGPQVPAESLEGVVEIDHHPYILIGERGAHWLLDWNKNLHPLPEGAWSVWSSSILRPPLNSPSRVPYLDAHGKTVAFTPAGTPVLRVEADRTISPVVISRSADEPGVIVTNDGRRVEVKHQGRRVLVSAEGRPAWRAVATSISDVDFAAIPLGNRWLLTGGHEVVMLDASLSRIDHGADMFVALTSQPRALWMSLLGVLGMFALALPWMLGRTLRELQLIDGDLQVGQLHLPPGAVGATSRGRRVHLSGNCQLRAGGHSFDLSPRPMRVDEGPPLCNGDQVYVIGEIESDQAGGPWRASHRRKIGGDRYFIGRGTKEDFALHMTARANQRLLAFTLVHLTLGFTVLGFLGLRPFI